ncbi:hypothetical protein OIO90_005023 [Microbotryomycetes sp. JL221]|nr:hypothetical protein OIO90_005023 [Microbotryomycetes sp. JL221]
MSLVITPSRASSVDSDEITLVEPFGQDFDDQQQQNWAQWYDPAYLAARNQYARQMYTYTERLWEQERVKIERRSSTSSNGSNSSKRSPSSPNSLSSKSIDGLALAREPTTDSNRSASSATSSSRKPATNTAKKISTLSRLFGL